MNNNLYIDLRYNIFRRFSKMQRETKQHHQVSRCYTIKAWVTISNIVNKIIKNGTD